MRSASLGALVAAAGCVTHQVTASDANRQAVASQWDQALVARTVDAAREAHRKGDLLTAERLCLVAFETIDQSALAAYDAYADLLKSERRAEEAAVRAQAMRLHELKARRAQASQPTSTYLGFSPPDGLNAYADAQRTRSLALAYRQVQQTHFQRTMLFQQGKDPRGAC